MKTEFSKQHFDAATPAELTTLCARLAEHLSKELSGAPFHDRVYALVHELQALGHDLRSQDEDDDFQIWGPDYVNPSGGVLVITFRAPAQVSVEPSASSIA